MRAACLMLLLCSSAQAGLVTFDNAPLGPFVNGLYSDGLRVSVNPLLTSEVVDLEGDRVVHITSPAVPSVFFGTQNPLGWTIHSFDVYVTTATNLRAQGNFDSNTPWVFVEYELEPGWSHIEIPAEFYGTREYFRTWAFPGVSEMYVDNIQWSNVPEPSAWVLLVIGAAGMVLRRAHLAFRRFAVWSAHRK